MTQSVLYVSFGLALLSACVSLFVFISIKTTRTDNKQAVILNRFVFYMSLVDFFNALLLSFLLFPSFVSSIPDDINDYVDETEPAVYIATPKFSGSWGGWLELLYVLQSFFWFTSFCFWFMIAVNLFLVLQTHSAKMIQDLYVHIYCWGLPAIFAFCMYEAITKKEFKDVGDTTDDWVMIELKHRAILVIVIYVCLAYLIFGVFLMFKTFCEFGVSQVRQRMTLFVGLSLLVWIPAFLEFLANHLSLMLISLASMGWVNGVVWISSSRFEPIGRCCWMRDLEVGDRTYLFANSRERGVETSFPKRKKRRTELNPSGGNYHATATSNVLPAVTIVNGQKGDLTVFNMSKGSLENTEEEDAIASVDHGKESLPSPAAADSEPVELSKPQKNSVEIPVDTDEDAPEEITPVNTQPSTAVNSSNDLDRKSRSPVLISEVSEKESLLDG